MQKFFDSKHFNCIGLILYKVCLDIVYVIFICGLYGYHKTFKLDVDFLRLTESWMLYVVLILFTPQKRKSISSYFLLMQLVISLAPMLTIYGLYQRSRIFIYLLCSVHCIQCLLDVAVKIPSTIVTWQGKKIIIILVVVVTLGTMALVLLKHGVPGLQALDYQQVYEIREERPLTFPLSYLVPWFFGVMLPIGMLEALSQKRIILLGVFTLAAFYFYIVFARKSWFFSVFLIMGFYILLKHNLFKKFLCWGMPCMVLGVTGLYYLDERLLILPSLFVRRTLFVPADIKFEYYAFFEDRPKLNFAEGVIGKLFGISSPYDTGIAYVIGDQLGEYGSSCNTGYLGDAYANLGTVGVILFAVIMIMILKILDMVSKNQYFIYNFSALSYCLYSLNDSALLTTLLTGGMLLIILMLIIRHEESDKVQLPNKFINNEKIRV